MLFSTPVLAVQPIIGAFGVKLGDVWDGEAIETWERDDYFIHRFIPEFPHDAFDTYYVEVTPVKGLIFKIEALNWENGAWCETEYKVFKEVLNQKYGKGVAKAEEKGGYSSSSWSFISFTEEPLSNREIRLVCNNALSLNYIDRFIQASRIKELAEQVDSSNL